MGLEAFKKTGKERGEAGVCSFGEVKMDMAFVTEEGKGIAGCYCH